MPEHSIPKDAAYQIINDELMLDGNPRLNLASFVTTWMEPECDKLIMAAVNKNYVDMDEYPVTTELQVCICATLFFLHQLFGLNGCIVYNCLSLSTGTNHQASSYVCYLLFLISKFMIQNTHVALAFS